MNTNTENTNSNNVPVNENARFVDTYGELGEFILQDCATDVSKAQRMMDERYCGEWGSKEAFAQELFYDIYGRELADDLRCYINYERFAWDIFVSDYQEIVINSQVHVFSQ